MNLDLLDGVRACPMGCGWEADRRLKRAQWTSEEEQVLGFVERCQDDLAAHLIVAHGARPGLRRVREYEANGEAA